VVIVAKVSLALIIALGPAFIACSLFDASRRFFFGWLSQAVNYLVLMALIIAVFQMILGLVTQQWSQIDGQDAMAGGLIFIALCILGAIFFLQTPSIAAGIAGGASAGISDFGNAIGAAFRGPGGVATSVAGGRSAAPRSGGSMRPARA
jgi:type IV secretion system protein VirB6